MKKGDSLQKATTIEWEASIFGAISIALGVGAYFSNYLLSIAPLLVILGILLHGWGMYKINERNK